MALPSSGLKNDDRPSESKNSETAVVDSRYMIDIPSFWSKEDLLDLRDYLEKAEIGLAPVWIRIHGLEKDTKFSVASIPELEEWLGKKGA